MTENQASHSQSEYANLPIELLASTLSLQFPQWYANYLIGDLSFTLNMIGKICEKRAEEAKEQEQEQEQEQKQKQKQKQKQNNTLPPSPEAIIFSPEIKSNKRKAEMECDLEEQDKKTKIANF